MATYELTVAPEASETGVPLRAVRKLNGGDRVLYRPVELHLVDSGKAHVALISIPTTPEGVLAVLESRPAHQPAEWIIPSRAAAIGLVFGPQGLDLQSVASLVLRDRALITQLADYAAKSAQTEALLEAVSAWERAGSYQSLESALQGFSSRYGVVFPKLDRNAPADQQAMVLMRTLHPALSSFDPLAPQSAQRMQQSAGLAASVAGLFFGSPVGLAATGGALFLNLRTMLFPGSDFRSALAPQIGDNSTLCAKREPAKSRTRLVYLWAWRVPEPPPPAVEGLPFRANLGAPFQVTLRGQRLEQIRTIRAEKAVAEFDPATLGLRVELPESARRGDQIDLELDLDDQPMPLRLPAALQVLGPRPTITRAALSTPENLPVALRNGEMPADGFVSFSLETAGAGTGAAALHLECAESALTHQKATIRPGQSSGVGRLQVSPPAGLYLLVSPGAIGHPPCTLTARVETADGASDPYPLGRVVRLPKIEAFTLTDEPLGAGSFLGYLRGEELQVIEKTGWNPVEGLPVEALPTPIAGDGMRQSLRVAIPWPPPSPKAPLYIWLRGESEGRRTKATL